MFPWQSEVFAELTQRLARGRLPHALLFAGPGGTGKRQFARAFAHSLLCEQRGADGTPCGTCASCRLLAAGTHPDLHALRPPLLALAEGVAAEAESDAAPDEDATGGEAAGSKTKASAEISVAQVRALSEALSVAAHRGGVRVALVYPADAMNAIAANALLKTLEEPGERVVFLLVSDAPHRLLSTIRSRCQVVPMPIPERSVALAWLAEQGGVTDEQLALVGGAPVRAAELAATTYWQIHAALTQALALGPQIDAIATARLLETEIKRQDREAQTGTPRVVDLRVVISWLQRWMHDAIRARLTQTIGYHRSACDAVDRVACVPLARLMTFHAWLGDAARQAGHPVNAQLFLEDSLLRYRALFDANAKPAV
jgi:DNA polymerase III subunit delta'